MTTQDIFEAHRRILALPQTTKANLTAEHLAADSLGLFDDEWTFLQNSETKLIQLMEGLQPADNAPGDIEYGTILYYIQTYSPDLVIWTLEEIGMPDTNITSDMYANWETRIDQGAGVITSDGTLVSTVPYAVFDLNWMYAYLYYLGTRYSFIESYPFGTTPTTLAIDGPLTLTIALISDWGTGLWADGNLAQCPSQLVSQAVQELAPDLVIHLGDVYYSGTASQEQTNMLTAWVSGNRGTFTLNSNHEMYDGANGYFGTALANSAFTIQQNTSYFAITFANWLIFGLDSAYYDTSTLYTSGTVNDADQLTFIRSILSQPGNAGKQIIVLTHHNALSYDGLTVNTRTDGSSLANDIYTALGNQNPDFWYYGHLHNGIVYNSSVASDFPLPQPGHYTGFRCLGHGAIPFGNGYGLSQPAVQAGIAYYSQTPLPNPGPRQTNRVLNGFTLLTLQVGSLTEQAYEVANEADPVVKWQVTTSYPAQSPV